MTNSADSSQEEPPPSYDLLIAEATLVDGRTSSVTGSQIGANLEPRDSRLDSGINVDSKHSSYTSFFSLLICLFINPLFGLAAVQYSGKYKRSDKFIHNRIIKDLIIKLV